MARRNKKLLFPALLAICVGSALFSPLMPSIQATASYIVAPVEHPANRIGNWAASFFEPPLALPGDVGETVNQLRAENNQLREHVERLLEANKQLLKTNSDRNRLGGSLRDATTPLTVLGLAGDYHDLLRTAGPMAGQAKVGMAVVHTGDGSTDVPLVGVAGTVDSVGIVGDASGVQVRLISDPDHRPIGGSFYTRDSESGSRKSLITQPFVVEGIGEGKVAILQHEIADLEAAGVDQNTYVSLSDPDWPDDVQGIRIGKVSTIEPLADKPQFARVVIEPIARLQRLREVLVVSKE